MYDYVLQYGFDKDSHNKIQEIKSYLKTNGIQDRERGWLPHITIDLYNCQNQDEFIDNVDSIVKQVKQFDIQFKNLNDCNEETLYIEPYNKDILINLKQFFDENLNKYMLEKRRTRKYIPHATLCTSDTLNKAIKLANDKFLPFTAKVKYIWVYSRDMKLMKQYTLETKSNIK